MNRILRALIVEDSEDDALLLLRELRRGGYTVEHEQVDTAMAMRAALDSQEWDIIFSDYSLPEFSAPQALAIMKEKRLDLPFIIVSGTIGEETAVTALLAGAHDFLIKGHSARLIPAVERELREAAIRREKQKADEALRDSEARYRLLFERNPLPLWVYDLETLRFLAVNEAASNHYGYSQSEFLNMTIKDIRPVEDIPALLKDVQAVPLGLSKPQTWRHQKKDGTVIDVEITAHDIPFGNRRARLVLANDISERKHAEEKLQRSYQRLQILHAIDRGILTAQLPEEIAQFALEFVVSQIAVWGASITLFDLQTNTGTVVASYSRDGNAWPVKTVFSLDVFLEKPVDRLNIADVDYVSDVTQLTPKPPGIQKMLEKGLRSYAVIPLIAQGALMGSLNLGSDQVAAFTVEQLDIAVEIADQLAIAIQQARFVEQIQRHSTELEQRVIERTSELLQTKERVEAILNNSSDAIVLASSDGIIKQVNPAFTTFFGYADEQVFGQSLLLLVAPEDVETLLNALRTVVNDGNTIRVEVACVNQANQLIYTDIALTGVFQENKISSIVCNIHNITERKQIEQGLRVALEKERELNELKSRFASMVSHEFRTPLAIITSSSELLQQYNDRLSAERKQEHFHQIHVQIRHLVSLLDDVLALSRAQTITIGMSAELVNLEALCLEIIGEIQAISSDHHIRFQVIGDHKPELWLDVKLIRQAITNLLSNAVKYSPNGGQITFDLIYETDATILRIQDEGIGIPQDDQQRLFEVFHRAKNVGTISGTGLGLPIVKQAVEAHGGTIQFESEMNVGTTFTVHLPVQPASELIS